MAKIANVRGEVLFPVVFAFYFAINAIVSDAIWLNLPATGTKCVSEEIQNNVVVLADYVVVSDDHSHSPTISVKVCEFFSISLFWIILGWNFYFGKVWLFLNFDQIVGLGFGNF